MKNLKRSQVLLMAAFVSAAALLAFLSLQPKTYEDCILKHAGKINDTVAAAMIATACEDKYGVGISKQKLLAEKRRAAGDAALDQMLDVLNQ